VLGDSGLQEFTYKNIEEKKLVNFDVTNGWLGITDKYWAATLLPDNTARLKARFSTGMLGNIRTFQTDYLLDAQTIAPGATTVANARLFAGAKEVQVVNDYDRQLKLNRFDLLIDWGWFYFITKPLFIVMDYFYRLVGNFGLAILIVTVLIKIAFFPLANKSYASMAKMKAVQPQMTALRERYADDKAKQQQELMELYRKEKINPLAGCLPIAIQIPVFFSLYKVLFVTIEMRHAPFFGWIHDLSAPDPTNIFTLFGLIPIDPTILPVVGPFLHLGLWPLIMGVTMWVQMKLNPAPPDPAQAMIFNWMPLIFTFMLASFRPDSLSTGPGTTRFRCCSRASSCASTAPRSNCSTTSSRCSKRRRRRSSETSPDSHTFIASFRAGRRPDPESRSIRYAAFLDSGFAPSARPGMTKRNLRWQPNSPARKSTPAGACSPASGTSLPRPVRPRHCRRCVGSRSPLPGAPMSASRASSTRSPAARASRASRTRPAARRSSFSSTAVTASTSWTCRAMATPPRRNPRSRRGPS
jgi:YidC/Oxa1 family membrane protein insertase